jgi:hypothetical protein
MTQIGRENALESAPRRLLTVGPGILLLGIALVGIDSSRGGGALVLVGLIVTIAGLHKFGRLGA